MPGKEDILPRPQEPDLMLGQDVKALDGTLLLPAGSVLTPALMKELISSRNRAFRAVPLLSHGKIKKDVIDFACTPPYDAVFKEREVVDLIIESMEGTQLAFPLLEALDFFRVNDFYSYRHCLMVFALSMLIAREITADIQDMKRLSAAGPVHDIGMLCVPLNVLNKKTPLTAEEKNLYESHSAAGYVLLSYYLGNTLNLACFMARDHHEKRDGSGYPRGVKLNDLLTEITAVCDIYDAMLSPRPYRAVSFDNRSALEEITKMAQMGRVRWDIVKALVALNRRTGLPHFQTEISLERRGAPPDGNLHGVLENGGTEENQDVFAQNQTHMGKIHSLCQARPELTVLPAGNVEATNETGDGGGLYRILFEQSPDCIMVINAEGKVVQSNEAVYSHTGYSREEFSGMHVSEIGLFRDSAEVRALINESYSVDKAGFEASCITKNGAVKNVFITGKTINLSGQTLLHLVLRDITWRKMAEEALLESEEKYRCLVESMDDSIYVVDRSYKYVFMNKRHAMRMGLSECEYAGRSFGEFHTPEETRGFVKDVDQVFETGEPVRHEFKSKKDGRYFVQIITPIRDKTGNTVAAIISRNITERRIVEEELRRLSLTDELTGLYNRRGFTAFSEQILRLYRRNRQKAFLLFADLDGLKKINDTFGHEEGDRALMATSDILKKTCRESDVIARIGGDEFVVVPFGSSMAEVRKITARLENNIENYNAKSAPGRSLSISLGVSCCEPDSECTIEELVKQAEKSMYEQKKQRRAGG